jgi:hypothetical protein
LRVWGFVRVAPYGTPQQVSVELRPRGSRTFRTIAVVATDAQREYLDVRIRVPASGSLRLAWRRPGGHSTIFSRIVEVRVI